MPGRRVGIAVLGGDRSGVFVDAIRRMYAYDAAVAGRVLDAAEALTAEQFVSVVVPGQRSVGDTLVHMMDTQIVHLSWIDGSMTREDSFARQFLPEDYRDVTAVLAFWQRALKQTNDFLETLNSDLDMERAYNGTSQGGTPRRRFLWEVLLHVANHSTQHRSEIALMLTAMSRSPGDLDLL